MNLLTGIGDGWLGRGGTGHEGGRVIPGGTAGGGGGVAGPPMVGGVLEPARRGQPGTAPTRAGLARGAGPGREI